jgi:hypothetical protein
MSAYNAQNKLARATSAGRSLVKDPGDGGTIEARTVQLAVCVVTGGTTRVLDAATKYGLGHRLIVISQTTSIDVDGTSLADGEAAEFLVILNSSGVKAWAVVISALDGDTFVEAAGTDGGDFAAADLVLTSGGNDKTAVDSAIESATLVTSAAVITGGFVPVSDGTRGLSDPTPVDSGIVDISTYTETVLKAILTTLVAAGLMTDSTTT